MFSTRVTFLPSCDCRAQVLKDMKKEKADKKKLDLQKKKVDDFSTKMKLAEKLAGVALGTSRLNYIDPRITLAWCKEAQFDFKRLFPKTQQARVFVRNCFGLFCVVALRVVCICAHIIHAHALHPIVFAFPVCDVC